jgi:hypothetical protein
MISLLSSADEADENALMRMWTLLSLPIERMKEYSEMVN